MVSSVDLSSENEELRKKAVNETVRHMADVVKACVTTENVDIDKMSSIDVQWIFLQIRLRSLGIYNQYTIVCNNMIGEEECGHESTINYDLNNVVVDRKITPEEDKKQSIVDIPDGIKLKLRHPRMVDVYDLGKTDDNEEWISKIVISTIESVIKGDKVIDMDDCNLEEKMNFVDSMSVEMTNKIVEYFQKSPVVKIKFDFTCPKCNHRHEFEQEGFEDFFE